MSDSSLESEEREKYEKLWGEIPEYRQTSPADLLTPLFLRYFSDRLNLHEEVIDFGCGPGRSAPHLLQAGLRVKLIDVAQNCLDAAIFLETKASPERLSFAPGCLWDLPSALRPAEWGICFDVLEHIPLKKVDDVLKNISQKVTKGALFAIELTEDTFGQVIGHPLHLSLLPAAAWIEKLSCFFQVEQILLNDERKLLVALRPK